MSPAATRPVPVPHPQQVRDLLVELLGRDVVVGLGDPVLPGPQLPAAVAIYVTDRTATGALCVCDVALAAGLGAALALIPARTAADAATTGILPTNLAENFYEVVNILASVFNQDEASPKLRLWAVHGPGETLPADVAAHAGQLARRLDLDVAIAGYGSGRLSIAATG